MITLTITRPATNSGTLRTLNLDIFAGSGDFTPLFQLYRIKSVTATWTLVNGLNANNRFPTLVVAPQHHTAAGVTPTRLLVSQYNNARIFQFAPSKVAFTKSYPVYGPILTTGSGQQFVRSPWYRCEDSGVIQVFAIEFIDGYNNTDTPNHNMEVTYSAVLEFKGTK